MSGIEVVAAVATIFSAFAGGEVLYRQWKQRRAAAGKPSIFRRWGRQKSPPDYRDLSLDKSTDKLETTLITSGPSIKNEYEKDVKVLGQAFAVGDDIGRSQLAYQLIVLQQSVIDHLQKALASGFSSSSDAASLDVSDLVTTAEKVRDGSIRALSDQFQRMSVAAPIKSALSVSKHMKDSAPASNTKDEVKDTAKKESRSKKTMHRASKRAKDSAQSQTGKKDTKHSSSKKPKSIRSALTIASSKRSRDSRLTRTKKDIIKHTKKKSERKKQTIASSKRLKDRAVARAKEINTKRAHKMKTQPFFCTQKATSRISRCKTCFAEIDCHDNRKGEQFYLRKEFLFKSHLPSGLTRIVGEISEVLVGIPLKYGCIYCWQNKKRIYPFTAAEGLREHLITHHLDIIDKKEDVILFV